jgi:hypothetical protein
MIKMDYYRATVSFKKTACISPERAQYNSTGRRPVYQIAKNKSPERAQYVKAM